MSPRSADRDEFEDDFGDSVFTSASAPAPAPVQSQPSAQTPFKQPALQQQGSSQQQQTGSGNKPAVAASPSEAAPVVVSLASIRAAKSEPAFVGFPADGDEFDSFVSSSQPAQAPASAAAAAAAAPSTQSPGAAGDEEAELGTAPPVCCDS